MKAILAVFKVLIIVKVTNAFLPLRFNSTLSTSVMSENGKLVSIFLNPICLCDVLSNSVHEFFAIR